MKTAICFFLLSVVLQLSSPSSLPGKSMHLLIMADDDDDRIGHSGEKNLQHVKDSFLVLASAMNVPIRTKILNAKRGLLTYERVMTWLNKELIALDDVVILYYSGHGGRSKDSPTLWPYGNFLSENVEFSGIMNRLFAKQAGLYVVLLDCCNIDPLMLMQPVAQAFPPRLINYNELNKEQIKPKCIDLFFKSKGLIIASASSPGQKGWCQSNNNEKDDLTHPSGGFFTTFFLNNLGEELKKDKAHWKDLLRKTRRECTALIEEYIRDKGIKDEQINRGRPQYRVFLRPKRKTPDHLRRYLFERCLPENVQP